MTYGKIALCLALAALVSQVQALPSADSIRSAFEQMDPNRDQRISLVEWDQHSFALFRAADTNRDGSLDAEEIHAGPGPSETFTKFDANQNGRLEIDEFMQLRRKLMQVADFNGSDTIDRPEFEIFTLLAEVGWEDTDNNGRLSFSELRAGLAKVFQLADTNQDGVLNETEASFLRTLSYAAITEHGPLSPSRLYVYYRNQLTGQ